MAIYFSVLLCLCALNMPGIGPETDDLLFQQYESAANSGARLRAEGDFRKAIDEFLTALDFAKKNSDSAGQVRSLMDLGILYWNVGKLEESSTRFREALYLAKKHHLKEEQWKCSNALEIYQHYKDGKKFRESGAFQKSVESFNQALVLARKAGSQEHELRCLIQLCITHWNSSNLHDFFNASRGALERAQSLNHKELEGSSLFSIALYYLKSESYSKSIGFYERALRITRLVGNRKLESNCLNNMGIIYEKMGEHTRSIAYLQEALWIDQHVEINNKDILRKMNNIGTAYRARGLVSGSREDFERALEYFQDSLETARRGNFDKREHLFLKRIEVGVLNNIGTVLTDLGDYADAMKYLSLGYQRAVEIPDFEAVAMILVNTGIVLFHQGYYEGAIESYQKAVERAEQMASGHVLWEAYFGLGECYQKIEEFSLARRFYEKAINVIDRIRSRISQDTLKAGFSRDKLKVYELLIELLSRMDGEDSSALHGKEIFRIVEKAKARAFLECLGSSADDLRNRMSSGFKAEEMEIAHRISALTRELAETGFDEKRREDVSRSLNLEEAHYLNLMAKMRAENPEIAALIIPEPCRVEEVQNMLDEKTALVEYFLAETRSFLFLITKNKFLIAPLPSREEIERSTRAYLKILSEPPRGRFQGILAAARIYGELLSPVEEEMDGSIENLIIVPDGILYYLPFETLVQPGPALSSHESHLIERYRISYVPSSSSLLFFSSVRPLSQGQKWLLAFANPSYSSDMMSPAKNREAHPEILKDLFFDKGFILSPLPYSEKEVQRISRYFPEGQREVYLNHEAREDILKELPLADYRIIHFACHGFIDEEFPLNSALILSAEKDSKEDGFLQVREISHLHLNADLVVLSACQTGKGKLEKVEGILGLPRIFFYSGARSVVLSLWKIGDKPTSRFMDSFYYHLSRGSGKSEALRLAKLRMRKSRFSHPHYWAAFVLNGEFHSRIFDDR